MSSLRAAPVEVNWHTGLPIYASETFLQSVGDQHGWIGGTDESGKLRCLLPYLVIRKFGFRMVRFCVETIPLDGNLDLDDEKSFLNAAVAYFRSTGADMIIPGQNSAIFRTYPDGAVAAPYASIIQDLGKTEEVLMSNIHPTFRYNIRRAIKAGVQVKDGMQYIRPAYDLIAETLKRSDVTFRGFNEFERIVLGLGDQVKIFIVEHEGLAQGCMVAPFSNHSAYTWYCGSLPEPVLGAMHLLHWEAMRKFRGMGVRQFDFQGVRTNPEKGSKQEGILNFKRRFGGSLVGGYMWKYSLRPLKFTTYSIAVRLLKGGDIVDLEHHKLASK